MLRYQLTIKPEDVGEAHCWSWAGDKIDVGSAIGRVQEGDIGKRVMMGADLVVTVENNDQRDKRLGLICLSDPKNGGGP